LVLPSLFFLGLWSIYPLGYNLWLSFHKVDIGHPEGPFVGLDQYISLLSDIEVLKSFYSVTIYTITVTVFQFILALVLASIANLTFKGRSLFRISMVLAWAIPVIAAANIWKFMLWREGVINYFLMIWGFEPVSWLENSTFALLSIIIVSLWKTFPFVFICILAGLQSIPEYLYEAAKIDGASMTQRFLHITLPNLKTILSTVIILRVIFIFNWFEMPWLLTKGGPGTATTFPSILIYLRAFLAYSLSEGAAISMLCMLILLIFIMLFFKLSR